MNAYVAGVLAAVCWGTAAVVTKVTLDFVPPVTLLVGQLVAAG